MELCDAMLGPIQLPDLPLDLLEFDGDLSYLLPDVDELKFQDRTDFAAVCGSGSYLPDFGSDLAYCHLLTPPPSPSHDDLWIKQLIMCPEPSYSCIPSSTPSTGSKSPTTGSSSSGTTEKRTYICSVCDRTFSCSSNLIRHKRVHTGDRPYKCSCCDYTFSNSSNKRKHEKICFRRQQEAQSIFACISPASSL